ncbi:hypothetical protein [Microbacterium sp. WCS2018Hpa-9]|uniref:hypothetical protein n=1 Tax=Microbacterium sp. WCS2018Hpa-9 TaxID=3073635 RepID=UPI00288907DA|nr:hypothetical protein [Microbacterium sp. WCS2018Hpa-9]
MQRRIEHAGGLHQGSARNTCTTRLHGEPGTREHLEFSAPRRRALTDARLDLREHSLAFRREYLEHLLADWTVDEIVSFEGLLTRFAASVAAHPPRPKPLHAPEGEHR